MQLQEKKLQLWGIVRKWWHRWTIDGKLFDTGAVAMLKVLSVTDSGQKGQW